MDKKKLKILLIADIVIIVGLVALMMCLKGKYNEQAQKAVKEQVGAYLEKTNGVLQEEWLSMDQYAMAWRIVYATLAGDKKESSFNANISGIEADSPTRVNNLTYIYTAAGIPDQVQKQLYEKVGLNKNPFLVSNENGVKTVACGKDCQITFTFNKGQFVSMDTKALAEYKLADHFKIEAPAPFHFE